jgi:putative membrane protein
MDNCSFCLQGVRDDLCTTAEMTMTRVEAFFSQEDLRRIEHAVQEAEKQTSGEIVPYAVYASDAYERAFWRAGLLFGTVALTVFVFMHNYSRMWMPLELAEVAGGTLLAALFGALFAYAVDDVRRFFAGRDLMRHRVRQRAMEAFVAEEVFNTKDRTGILIFLSLLEHHVLVIGDSGINAKVQQAEWDSVVKTIVDGMKAHKPAEGLIAAIRQCGQLLHREGVGIKPDDKNELSNKMRTSER